MTILKMKWMRKKFKRVDNSTSRNMISLKPVWLLNLMKHMTTSQNRRSSNINIELAMMMKRPIKEDKVDNLRDLTKEQEREMPTLSKIWQSFTSKMQRSHQLLNSCLTPKILKPKQKLKLEPSENILLMSPNSSIEIIMRLMERSRCFSSSLIILQTGIKSG